MGAELLAILAALAFGMNNFFMGIGLRHASPATGATVSVLVNGTLLWLFHWHMGMRSPWMWAPVGIFVVAGVCAPGMARFSNYVGFKRIGAANAVSLTATSPLFAAVLAILILGEHVTVYIGIGTVLVVVGAVFISRSGQTVSNWRKRDMIWPFMAGLLFAMRDIIVRFGLRDYREPILAASLTVTTSFVMLISWQFISGDLRTFNPSRRNVPYFVLGAIFVTASYILMFTAFSIGNVVTVTPLVAVHPLATIALTVIFLRKTEVVTWRTILGAVLIIGGATVIGVGDKIFQRW